MTRLLFPGDPRCADESVVGGKAANLAALAMIGVPVPRFFAIPVELVSAAPDEELAREVARALESLGPDPVVAVRSSAIGEDSATSSFAGVYETVLDVRGLDDVLRGIGVCWDSLHSSAAAAYREQQDGPAGGMGVVVQEMVSATWAGVCFTADPTALALSRGVIDAARGGGEAVVSGEVTPARVVVDVATAAPTEARPDETGAFLPEPIVAEVWRLSRQLAEELGFPQDVEWAADAAGRVHVLQSRPITTLGAVVANQPLEAWRQTPRAVDDPQRVWTRVYSDEVMTPPSSPLFYTLHDQTGYFRRIHDWHGSRLPMPEVVQKHFRAAAYFDVDVFADQYAHEPRFARIPSILAFLPPDRRARLAEAPWEWRGWLRRLYLFEVRERRRFGIRHNDRYLQSLWPEYDALSAAWGRRDTRTMDVDELWSHLREVDRRSTPMKVAAEVTVFHAFNLKCLLVGLLDRWVGDGDAVYAAATVGLQGATTVVEAQTFWELAHDVRELPALREAAERGDDWEGFRREAVELGDPSGVVARFEAFRYAHRHRGATYKDVMYPRWGDDPDLAFAILRSYVGSEIASPAASNEGRAASREAAQAGVLARLAGPRAAYRRPILRALFSLNERYMRQRDDYRFRFDHIWFELRRVYLALGRELVERGLLATVEDVFFLGRREVRQALKGELDAAAAAERVALRRDEWDATRADLPPTFMRAYVGIAETPPASGDAIAGIAASPGTVRARARVIEDAEQLADVGDGEVVVTRRTDPGWTSAFPRLGGLVLETGGVLSHGASLCREFELPCVTAAAGATRSIADGDLIEVLGSEGEVRILERSAALQECGGNG